MLNIEFHISAFKDSSGQNERYSSFDYCYNYFYSKSTNPKQLLQDIEKSCLVLGFYLASWGMLRGSSFLLEKSVKHFEPLIRHIAELDRSYWEIDVDTYSENTNKINELYQAIKDKLIPAKDESQKYEYAHLTLVTKVLLGVFGCIPAYDQYFVRTFKEVSQNKCGFTAVNQNSLSCIQSFYLANKDVIDHLSATTFTKDFITGEFTKTKYTKAKIIDMYGFQKGLNPQN